MRKLLTEQLPTTFALKYFEFNVYISKGFIFTINDNIKYHEENQECIFFKNKLDAHQNQSTRIYIELHLSLLCFWRHDLLSIVQLEIKEFKF